MSEQRHFLKLQCEYAPDQVTIYAGDCSGEVKFRNAMTAYHYTGPKDSLDDPNRRFVCCDGHYEEYVAHWRDMWSNVERG